MDPTKATKIETEFILDIRKRFSSLWIIGEGGYGRGKFLDAVFTVMHVLLLKFIVSRGRVAWQ